VLLGVTVSCGLAVLARCSLSRGAGRDMLASLLRGQDKPAVEHVLIPGCSRSLWRLYLLALSAELLWN
jgi:hypothetical protein